MGTRCTEGGFWDRKARAAGTAAPVGSPYLAGVQAFLDGVVVGDNPHHEDTDEHWRWMSGWVSAGMESHKANDMLTVSGGPGEGNA